MKDAGGNRREPDPDPANLSQAELVSNQEGTVVPWFAGERKLAVTWISPVYDLVSRDAGGGKK